MRLLALGLGLVCAAGGAFAQEIMSDLMSGKLVKPEVGAFAWYNLTDATTGREYFLRQAIVGADRVKRKDAWWLETELVPKIGFPSVYKMLLTGPASDPGNVHRLLVREGNGAVQEVHLEQGEHGGNDPDTPRELVGTEEITLPNGRIEAEHYVLENGDSKTEIWISEAVPPMGLVRMKTPQGELSLQRYGVGGKDGESAMPGPGASRDGQTARNAEEAAPAAEEEEGNEEEAEEDSGKKRVRTNIGVRRHGRR